MKRAIDADVTGEKWLKKIGGGCKNRRDCLEDTDEGRRETGDNTFGDFQLYAELNI